MDDWLYELHGAAELNEYGSGVGAPVCNVDAEVDATSGFAAVDTVAADVFQPGLAYFVSMESVVTLPSLSSPDVSVIVCDDDAIPSPTRGTPFHDIASF